MIYDGGRCQRQCIVRRSYRRLNAGTTAVRTPVQRRYNGVTTPVQQRPDRASSILKTLFRTNVCIVRRASYRILQQALAAVVIGLDLFGIAYCLFRQNDVIFRSI